MAKKAKQPDDADDQENGSTKNGHSGTNGNPPQAPGYEHVHPSELLLDPKNPRLVDYGLGEKPTQSELLRVLWQKMAVDELVMSLASRGYFEHEPMFVTKEGGKNYVIEGNRRLAAIKILLDPELRSKLRISGLPTLSAEMKKNLQSVPIIRTTRKEIWRMPRS